MDRSVLICSIFLTLTATATSKGVNFDGNEDVENATSSESLDTVLRSVPLVQGSDSNEKFSGKRSLLILMPSDDAKRPSRSDETECASPKSQKTKRCKALLRGNPRLQLVSLKPPNVASKHEANAEDRRAAIVEALRKKLRSGEYKLGAIRGRPPPKTSVIDDDKYVCYCREKSNPLSRKDAIPRQRLPKNKPERKNDNKKMLPDESRLQQKPIYAQRPPHPFLFERLPIRQPDNQRYLPGQRLPEGVNPIFQHGGVPYVPYIYHVDPQLAMLPGVNQAHSPTRISIPFNRIDDSLVGQRAPSSQRGSSAGTQGIGQQHCSPNVAAKHSQSAGQGIPASSAKTAKAMDTEKQNEQREESGENSDNNFQSVRLNSPEHPVEYESPASGVSSPDKDDLVSAANPKNEYGTTSSGTLDYSDIREVTSTSFTSKAYNENGDEIELPREPTSFNGFHPTSVGPMDSSPDGDQDRAVNLGSTLNNPTESPEGPVESATNAVTRIRNKENTGSSSLTEDDPVHANDDEEDAVVGESDPSWNQGASAIGDLHRNIENVKGSSEDNMNNPEEVIPPSSEVETVLISEGLAPADGSDATGNINHGVSPSADGFFTGDYSSESPEMEDNTAPLKDDHGADNLNSDKVMEKIAGQEGYQEGGRVNDPSMDGTVQSPNLNDDYTTNEDSSAGGDEETMGTPYPEKTTTIEDPSLPFCDNSLLQKSIKSVINNFAAGNLAETDGNGGGELVGSPADDLLQEIVEVPNLKSILSMPPIEHTVLDRVKNLLARVTGVPRMKFDGEWPTNVIRNSLRDTLAAAPSSKAELPENTVVEHQFRDGKWVTNLATLAPTSNEEVGAAPSALEKLRTDMRSLLRDPVVGLQAAKKPVVQNMILQSLRDNFNRENPASEQTLDDSFLQDALESELNLMEAENLENTTINTEEEPSEDLKDIDVNKFLEIARDEAGITQAPTSTMGDIQDTSVASTLGAQRNTEAQFADTSKTTDETQEYPKTNQQEAVFLGQPKGIEESLLELPTDSAEGEAVGHTSSVTESCDLVGATRHPKLTTYFETPSTVAYSVNKYPKTEEGTQTASTIPEEAQRSISPNPPRVSPGDRDETSIIDGTPKHISTTTEETVGLAMSTESPSKNSSPDYTYLGKISVKKNNPADDVHSLSDSELFYVGDGVKLPLEIRKLPDGSYGLSISRRVCEHLLNEKCPCCVPVNGSVVGTVRKPETEDGKPRRRRIAKRGTGRSISSREHTIDDSLQISMPVETFARRYNLSLNLEKVQAPWNFDETGKIDDPARNRGRSGEDKRHLLRDLFSVHGVPENGEPEVTPAPRSSRDSYENSDAINYKYRGQKGRNLGKYRYGRNIDRSVNERVEIVTDVLYWLRDMILDANNGS
ncbi:uncharacterized protein LOC116431566 [Nomia melanderi]|uniref:uncharacterized protein LOC116431566 n=1 Tax=Nomia melanderi TaxID=2448451 RepID=UPI003FCC4572